MSRIILTLEYYLQYPFVRYALIVGVLISLCSALLGVTLVLKRFSFIGDGLSHIAFGAMAIASVLNFTNNTPFVIKNEIILDDLYDKDNNERFLVYKLSYC